LFIVRTACTYSLNKTHSYPRFEFAWENVYKLSIFNVNINKSGSETAAAVSFSDQLPTWQYSVSNQLEATYSLADTTDTVQSFFERPILTRTLEWPQDTALYETFNPWTDFFENPRIINRISNFALLRCKLNVKFVLNGNAFFYGRAICSYTPLPDADKLTTLRAGVQQDYIEASQRPHVYLDPTTSEGGMMELPFFFFKNNMETTTADWRKMGLMSVSDLTPLRNGTQNSDPISISVYVWASDLHLSQPTSVEPLGMVPQADEYVDGRISGPATTISRVAGTLSSAPMIGPYMRATEMAARSVASIAKLFGYSKPRLIEAPNLVRQYMPAIANTNVADNCFGMGLDSKKEVTIDPRTVGLSGEDEMSIVGIAKRECYINSFAWEQTNAVGDLLWNCRVHPAMFDNYGSDPVEYHLTPSCFVSNLFKFWRGSMEFRLQCVASQYHKGRLRIVWDPVSQDSSEYNLNYQYVIDISQSRDFTVKIGWGQATAYLEVPHPAESAVPFSTTSLGFQPTNGILSVYVVTELTSATDETPGITINAFSNMCDDFELACPINKPLEQLTIMGGTVSTPLSNKTLPGTLYADEVANGEKYFTTSLSATDFDVVSRTDTSAPVVAGPLYWNTFGWKIDDVIGTYTVSMSFKSQSAQPPFPMTITAVETGLTQVITIPTGSKSWTISFEYDYSTTANGLFIVEYVWDMPLWDPPSCYFTIQSTSAPRYPAMQMLKILPGSTLSAMTGSTTITSYAGASKWNITSTAGAVNFLQGSGYTCIPGTQCLVGQCIPCPLGSVESLDSSGTVITTRGFSAVPTIGGTAKVVPDFTFIDGTYIKLRNSAPNTLDVANMVIPVFADGFIPEADETVDVDTSNAPIDESPEIMMGPSVDVPKTSDIHFGEVVASLRTVLKRPAAWISLALTSGPYSGKAVPCFPDSRLTGTGVTKTANTPLDWISSAYVGRRGSLRIYMTVQTATQLADSGTHVVRGAGPYPGFGGVTMIPLYGPSWEGSYITPALVGVPKIFEVPWYSRWRFEPSRYNSVTYDPANGYDPLWFNLLYPPSNTIAVAAGEDFNLFFFLCTPVCKET